ncbi:DNA primase [Nocardia sp. NPDC004860]|uniref:DNA primase n=1 Tax=Nocardia sp. NPDC004860 TaxID=3154557 RepID=UPI0033BA8647
MPGRLSDRDIAAIRERVRIEDIVGGYVTLKPAGPLSMKGLCPFHDENSPSFHVRPQNGHFHCFGCGESGDVFTFVQKIEHVGFVEAVEQMADRIGHTLTYEGGGTSVQRDRGTRARLVAANAAAHEFYTTQLATPAAAEARTYLIDRHFDAATARHFGCGYAPGGWDTLTKHLLRKGFNAQELEAAGLSRPGRHGPVDRFHRRLLWPIRNLSGDVIGFGARRVHDDDPVTAKYLNTPETLLYKKSQVLFGLDLAKRDIVKSHQAVIVEGYTDVMAMHAAGVTTAVAACGTAFGHDHLALLRRLLMDDNFWRGEVIFTFDGDAAGQAAARKAFAGDQKLAGHTSIAVAPAGLDPCELRQLHGDGAVRDLIARRIPLYEFVIHDLLKQHDLDTVEGRTHALRRTVPVVAQIKDTALRSAYATRLAYLLGWSDINYVTRAVAAAARTARHDSGRIGAATAPARTTPIASSAPPGPDPDDPALRAQRQLLAAALQYPGVVGAGFDALDERAFTHPAYIAIRAAIHAAGGTAAQPDLATVTEHADETVRGLVRTLAAEPIPVASARDIPRIVHGILLHVQQAWIGRQTEEVKSQLQRVSPTDQPDMYRSLFDDLIALEQYRRTLLTQSSADASTRWTHTQPTQDPLAATEITPPAPEA